MASGLILVSHALCPYVQRAAIALAEKGVKFERIDIDLGSKPAWFLAVSPLGKTPVLLVPRDGAMVPVFESAVICDYLDETVAPPLHPRDALDRATHRAWIEVASATLNTIAQLYSAPDDASLEQRRRELARRFTQIEAALEATPHRSAQWFDGRAFSLVDAAFAPVFRYFEVFSAFIELRLFEPTPRMRAWRDALAQRDSVRVAAPADYPRLLRAFVERRPGALGEMARAQRVTT